MSALAALAVHPPGRPLIGAARPPGSKSITNRMLLLAALAEGESRLSGALNSEDTDLMSQALLGLGVEVALDDSSTFHVRATGKLRQPADALHLGNAGTATRFLTAAAALVAGDVVLDGDPAMRRRPIQPLLDALFALGVASTCPTGCPPVTVHGQGALGGGRAMIDAGLSSQFVSALLMVAPRAKAPVEITLSGSAIGARGYVDLTLAAMAAFGVEAETLDESAWRIRPQAYRAGDHIIEPDASAATYLWAAAALTGGAIDLGLTPDAFSQPDAKAACLMARYPHMPDVIEASQFQDAVPTLAVVAAFNRTPVRFTGIANLRVKESDRIAALAHELNRVKPGLAEEIGDDLLVHGDPGLAGAKRPARIATYKDHRIAMSFALAGLLIEGVVIEDPGCVAKTWPDYFQVLASLGVHITPA